MIDDTSPDSRARRQIDLMVDGELGQREQQELLGACEAHPRRWRDLALAYVEAQSWRKEFRLLVEPQHGVVGVTRRERRKAGEGWVRAAIRPLALAAAVLLSMGFGYGYGLWWQGPPEAANSTTAVARTSPPDSVPTSLPLVVSDARSPELQQIDIPLIRASQVDAQWLQNLPAAIPRDVAAALRQRGHVVTEHRSYYPVRLSDGSLVLLPVDDVNVSFSEYSYQ